MSTQAKKEPKFPAKLPSRRSGAMFKSLSKDKMKEISKSYVFPHSILQVRLWQAIIRVAVEEVQSIIEDAVQINMVSMWTFKHPGPEFHYCDCSWIGK